MEIIEAGVGIRIMSDDNKEKASGWENSNTKNCLILGLFPYFVRVITIYYTVSGIKEPKV